MARCGCSGSCSCVIEGVSPIVVSGNGSVQQPYTVSIRVDGKTGCAGIVACVATALGPGLTYDAGSGKLQVKLSTDSGQTARFGSDMGLLVTGSGTPTPESCMRGIDSLPAAPGVLGAEAMAGLHGPYSSPYMLDFCLNAGADLIGFRSASTSDSVAVVSDYADHVASRTRSNVYVTNEWRNLSASQARQVWSYAGDRNNPTTYSHPDSNENRDDRRGGWYGCLSASYYQPLVGDLLDRMAGKAVALLDCYVEPSETSYGEAVAVHATIRAVLDYCAQGWAMIGVEQLANATTVLNAGITACMMPVKPTRWAETVAPYPVADLTGAGVKWIVLSDRFADSVFTAYKNAGINVLLQGGSRHVTRARVERLGIRGVYAMDPVYYRGPAAREYRDEADPWEQRRYGTGALTYRTDQSFVLSPTGNVRGLLHEDEQGLFLSPGWGDGVGRPSVLCGWLCPLRNPDSYTIEFDLKWTSLATVSPSSAKLGLLFGAATDAEPFAWPNDATINPMGFPEGQRPPYRVYQRQSGEIGIAKWNVSTGAFSYLATATSPSIAANVWNSYLLTVTPTTITLRRTLANGQQYTVSANDNQIRGGYVWVEKEESSFGSPKNPFGGAFRNVYYTPGT